MNPFPGMQGPILEADTAPAIDCIITLAFFGTSTSPLPIVRLSLSLRRIGAIFLLTILTKDPMLTANIKKQFIY